MRTVFGKFLGIAAIATSLAFAEAASAIPIVSRFNFVPFGDLNTK